MTPQLTLYDDLPALYADVREHLEAHEAENGLLLGFLSQLAQRPPAEPPFVARCHVGEATTGVAYMSGLNLIVSRGTHAAHAPLVRALRDRRIDPPGLVGLRDDVEPLADAWTEARGCARGAEIEQMLYELRAIDWPTGVPGAMHPMAESDVELVARWLAGFHREAVPHDPFTAEQALANAAARPASGMTYLWKVDGVLVAMAALARPTRRGITVNAVYTPEEHRRHGYASALVAALSDEGLRRGKDFCVLYTDLANPTSNAIYQAIGYRPVSRAKNVRFVYP